METTSRPVCDWVRRGNYVRIRWPYPLQKTLLGHFDTLPDIVIEPRKGQRRLMSLRDVLDIMFLWRSGNDLTDAICTFLWEYRAEDDGDFEERVLTVEDIVVLVTAECEPYLSILPNQRFVTLPCMNEQLLLVAL